MAVEPEAQPLVRQVSSISQPVEIKNFNSMDGRLNVRRFALSSTRPDSETILELLDYFKRGYMRYPYVRQITVGILGCLANNDIMGQVQTVSQWVKDTLIYVRDPEGTELVYSPVRLLQQVMATGRAYGDCDDHALLLNTMLGSLGIPTRFVGVKTKTSTKYNHVICSAKIGQEWVDVDPCSKYSVQPYYTEKLII